MPWKTSSTDPRDSWHWYDGFSEFNGTRAVCGFTTGKPILGEAGAIKGRMKACAQCVRKLARRASTERNHPPAAPPPASPPTEGT